METVAFALFGFFAAYGIISIIIEIYTLTQKELPCKFKVILTPKKIENKEIQMSDNELIETVKTRFENEKMYIDKKDIYIIN